MTLHIVLSCSRLPWLVPFFFLFLVNYKSVQVNKDVISVVNARYIVTLLLCNHYYGFVFADLLTYLFVFVLYSLIEVK